MSQREEVRQRTRRLLLDAALTEFLGRGLEGASTRAIAAGAGVSQATVFHHFESKQAMYDALVALGLERTGVDVEEGRADPVAALARTIHDILALLRENPGAARMFLFMSRASLGESPAAADAARRTIADTAHLIQLGQETGRLRAGDPRALAVAHWGALQGIAEVLSSDPTLPLPEESWLLALLAS